MTYFKIYTDFADEIAELTDEEKGRLFVLMLEYAKDGAPPIPQGNERYIWKTVQKMIDSQREAYQRICERNKANGMQHKPNTTQENPVEPKATQWLQDKDKDKDKEINIKEKHANACKEKRFAPPSLDEVKAYCSERHNSVDAERFVDYYQAQKWRLSNGVPMSDWKAALRNWERREQKPKKTNRVIAGYSQSPIGDIENMVVKF